MELSKAPQLGRPGCAQGGEVHTSQALGEGVGKELPWNGPAVLFQHDAWQGCATVHIRVGASDEALQNWLECNSQAFPLVICQVLDL